MSDGALVVVCGIAALVFSLSLLTMTAAGGVVLLGRDARSLRIGCLVFRVSLALVVASGLTGCGALVHIDSLG